MIASSLQQLRVFVAVADELGFTAAARRLHMAQQPVSATVRRLEQQLGVTLFDRTTRRVSLTPAGEALVASARAAVEAADQFGRLAAEHRDGDAGLLRVGLSPGVHYRTERLVEAFRARRPATRIQVREASTDTLVEQIRHRELDVAVGFCLRTQADLRVEHLLEERVVVAVPAEHALVGQTSVALEDLVDERFAVVDERDGSGYNDAVRSLCRSAGFTPRPSPSPLGPVAWETAVTRDGCVGLTTRMASVSTLPGIALIDVEPRVTLPVHLVWATTRVAASAVRDFREAAAELPN